MNYLGIPLVRALASTLGAAAVPVAMAAWLFWDGALGVRELGAAWRSFGLLPVCLASLASLVQVACQAVRYWSVARESTAINWTTAARIFIFGQLGNLFLPARAGDLGKVVATAATPRQRSSPEVAGAAAIVLADKVVDLGSVVLIALAVVPSSLAHMGGIRWSGSTFWWGLAGLAVIPVVRLALPAKWRAKAVGVASKVRGTLRSIAHPRALILAFTLGVTAWVAEALSLRTLAAAAGYELPLSALLTALIVLNIGIAVPLTPAHIGTFEAALAYGLSLGGVSAGHGLAIALVHHAVQVGSVVVWALVAYVSTRREARASPGLHATPTDKSRALDHFRRVASSYDDHVRRGPLSRLRNRERSAVLELAQLDGTAQSMIDVGCGAGFYALRAKQAGMYVCASDAVEQMLDRLKARVDLTMVADVESLTSDLTYDRVVCAGVLDFVANPEVAMKNLASLVAPGGRLVLLVPFRCPGGLLYRLDKLFIGVRVNLFDSDWLIAHAARHGLTFVEKSRPLPWNAVFLFTRSPATEAAPARAGSLVHDVSPATAHEPDPLS